MSDDTITPNVRQTVHEVVDKLFDGIAAKGNKAVGCLVLPWTYSPAEGSVIEVGIAVPDFLRDRTPRLVQEGLAALGQVLLADPAFAAGGLEFIEALKTVAARGKG